MTKRKSEERSPVKAAPGPRTSQAIEQAQAKRDALPLRPFMEVEESESGTRQMAATHSDAAGHSAWLMSSLGTSSTSFLIQQLNSLEVATAGTAPGTDPNVFGINAALAMLGAIDPQDELEGALATQMVGCHSLSMAMLCRAKSTTRTDQLQLYGNLAVKLQRTFTAQIEALARMRGKGQQTVRVEHVTVHPGGQAIVGDVNYHPGGPGAHGKSEVLPHEMPAAGLAAPSSALPSPNPLGDAVPLPVHAKRKVPAARRAKSRTAARE
ncbi:hypothetical protein [Sphingomonas faeni]|uniref:hypothetical protein n=1 Tax=Sphingomonas faeni TaxID=185950 RepID=UPI0027863201|nr:hypothetical protein [Sphingomonas faeni]MDQ0839408.1 hypothetical protein [Sphingomonas faeni]